MGNHHPIVEPPAFHGTVETISPKPEGEKGTPKIDNYQITTDSVVATIVVNTPSTVKRIMIGWGDGQDDALIHRPGEPPVAHQLGEEPLPTGTYKFQHVYEVSEDGMPFRHTVTLFVEGGDGSYDLRIEDVDITPRWKVNVYSIFVRLGGPCDFRGEKTSEFDITQVMSDDGSEKEWHWEPSNSFFSESQWFRLEGSPVVREVVIGETVYMHLAFVEQDPVFDDYYDIHLPLHGGDSGPVELTLPATPDLFSSCTVKIKYDREVRLIVPVSHFGPVLVAR